MRLPAILDGVPRIVFVLAIPVVAFIVAAGISLGRGGSDTNNSPPASSNVSVSLAPSQATAQPTPTAAPVPTSTSQPNRANCTTIRGTAYQSEAEREWFQKNCGSPTPSAGGSSASTSAQSTAPTTNTTNPNVAAPAAPSGGGYAQSPMGDRLVISRIGVNVDVWRAYVDPSGYMPDPKGYFNAVWYDFASIPGLGGYINGNMVLAAHVDCGYCVNGGPGLAAFYYVRNLSPGDTAQYYTSTGQVYNYTVVSSVSYDPYTNWASIVDSGRYDMTLITCTGTFSGGEYNLRHVVGLVLQ